MVKRPLVALAALTATAVMTSGCVSFSWERRERNTDGFSVETAPPAQALEQTGPTSVPKKPRDPIVTRSDTELTVAWNPPNDSGGGKVKYQTRISKPDEISKYLKWSKPSRKTQASYEASPYSRYRIQIRAVNDLGKSEVAKVIASPVLTDTPSASQISPVTPDS